MHRLKPSSGMKFFSVMEFCFFFVFGNKSLEAAAIAW